MAAMQSAVTIAANMELPVGVLKGVSLYFFTFLMTATKSCAFIYSSIDILNASIGQSD